MAQSAAVVCVYFTTCLCRISGPWQQAFSACKILYYVQKLLCNYVRIYSCIAPRVYSCTAPRVYSCIARRIYLCIATRIYSCNAPRVYSCNTPGYIQAQLQGYTHQNAQEHTLTTLLSKKYTELKVLQLNSVKPEYRKKATLDTASSFANNPCYTHSNQ